MKKVVVKTKTKKQMIKDKAVEKELKCMCGKKAKVRGLYCYVCYKVLKDMQRGR